MQIEASRALFPRNALRDQPIISIRRVRLRMARTSVFVSFRRRTRRAE
jgi:hypothetical protein